VIQAAWAAFQRSEYHTALSEFKTAVAMDTTKAEGYDGKGWSYALLDSLSESCEALLECLERDPTRVDPLVCLAAVYRDLPDLDAAIENAQQALALEPTFVFHRRSSYDWRDLRLILAECFYALADYELAYAEVRELDSSFEIDPADEDYAELLLLKIEELVSLYGGL
jgi:tetratricopeptide (TPR) repeat protein